MFISSVNGRLSMPMIGLYCASKFALEAAADALRMELRPWHIPVVIVEPAQTDTDMWRTADTMVADVEAALTPEQRALYAKHIAGMKKMVPMARRMAVDPPRSPPWSRRHSPRAGHVLATSSAPDPRPRWC